MVGPNQRYGLLTTIQIDHKSGGRNWWRCRCDCGNYTTIRQDSLHKNRNHSCGCTRKTRNQKHGDYQSSTYQSWRAMRRRCNDKKFVSYPFYGALGVRVCAEWDDSETGYQQFLADMGERPAGMTLDRKDTTGDYTPGNCRWATRKVQDSNKRMAVETREAAQELDYWEEQEREYLKGLENSADEG